MRSVDGEVEQPPPLLGLVLPAAVQQPRVHRHDVASLGYFNIGVVVVVVVVVVGGVGGVGGVGVVVVVGGVGGVGVVVVVVVLGGWT